MAYKNAHGLSGTLAQNMSSSVGVLQLDPSSASQLQQILGAGDNTYLLIGQGANAEVVQVFDSATAIFPITRAQDGSDAYPHAAGDAIRFVLTAVAIAAAVVVPQLPITGSGTVQASIIDGVYTIVGVEPNYSGQGIEVSGDYPDYSLTLTQDDTGCCGSTSSSSSSTGITNLYGYGIAEVQQYGTTAQITVETPNFVSAGNTVDIEGSWPNFNFETISGGAGTVTLVSAGSGITVTGNPAVNPTIGLNASGVTAGTYGGLVVDAFGRLTDIDPAFNPPSSVSVTAPLTATVVGTSLTLGVTEGAEGELGVLALAVHTAPLDPSDASTAVSPALLASVVDALAGANVVGATNYSPEATAVYSNIVSSAPLAIELAAGQQALVRADITMLNTATPLTATDFAMAVFKQTGASLLMGNRRITQNQQSMDFILTGPYNDGIVLTSSPPDSGVSIVSYGLTAVIY
jgi:hypothetical protein